MSWFAGFIQALFKVIAFLEALAYLFGYGYSEEIDCIII